MQELKMILETLTAAGAGAKDVAILWLCFKGAHSLALVGVLGYAVFSISRVVTSVVDEWRSHGFAASLRSIVCPQYNYGDLTRDEQKLITEAVRRGMEVRSDD